jgi:hypothetical protein
MTGAMDQRARLLKSIEEAERELDAAKKLSEVRAAATKKRLALEGLRWIEEQENAERPGPACS